MSDLDEVKKDAKVAAAYMATLIGEGVSMNNAITLTSEYLRSIVTARAINKSVSEADKKPWE